MRKCPLVGDHWVCSGRGGLVSWRVPSLPAGASGSASFTVDVASPLLNGTVLKSVASISADDGLPDSDSAPFMVSSAPIWTASKSADAASVDSGGMVTFSIRLQNLGNAAATGVVVTDTLPAGLQPVSAGQGGTVDTGGNQVSWNLGTVAPGTTPIVLTLTARVLTANETLTNTAQLSSNELPTLSVNASVDVGPPPAIPSLSSRSLAVLALLLLAAAGGYLWRTPGRRGNSR